MGRKRLHNEGDICNRCFEKPVHHYGRATDGSKKFRAICRSCHDGDNVRPWLKWRKKFCEWCGHKPKWYRSLDVHHSDGNKDNNNPDNLITLCATCHREVEGEIHHLKGDTDQAEKNIKEYLGL